MLRNALLLSISALAVFSQDRIQFVDSARENGTSQVAKTYPFNPSSPAPDWVQEYRFKANIDEEKVYNNREKMRRFDSIMEGTLHLDILQEPVHKPFKTVDTLYVHPSFTTTIIFPQEYTIDNVSSSLKESKELIEFDKKSNFIKLHGANGDEKMNLTVTMNNKQENIMIQLFIVPFQLPDIERLKIKRGNYVYANEYLSTTYRYHNAQKLTVNDRSSIIEQLPNLYENIVFKKNGDYYPVNYNGTTYYVVRDDNYGTIFFRNQKLRISQRKELR